jgi:carbonic anhydrase
MVVHTDFNMLSVLQYAVEVLKVKHVIVCGHYNCGGVKAAMTHQSLGIINKWLRNIKDVYRIHYDEINYLPTETEQVNKLIELNVQEQVMNLAKTSIIQKAWKENNAPHLHGWVYGLDDGLIKPIFEMAAGTHIDPIYEFDNL